MAVGQHTAARELDSLLNQLYQADYTVSNNSLHHQALNSDVHMGFEDVIANPQAYDYSEEISQHQNSKRDNQSPTLVKQKTIESVRFVIEPTEIEDNVEYRSPSTSEISGSSTSERLSCSPTAAGGFAHPIVGYQAASGGSGMTSTESVESNGIWMKQINSEADVVPVNNQTEVVNEPERENEISKTENEHLQNIVRTIIQILSSQFQCATVLTLDIGNSLRDLIVALARQHFQRVPTDLLHSQLGSVVLDVVNPYLDMPIQPNRKQFLRELSVILYNELSFFHILNSVQSIPD